MIGAVVFVIVFVLVLLVSMVPIVLPPGFGILDEFIPDIVNTEYYNLAAGIINGVFYGIIAWIAFSIAKYAYDKSREKDKIKKE